MIEVWRVVLADGSVRSVEVDERNGLWLWRCRDVIGAAGTPHEAVALWLQDKMVRVREILAPGEPTRAELLAASAGVAERVREAAVEACAARRVRCFDAERDAIDDCADAISAMDLTAAVRGAT